MAAVSQCFTRKLVAYTFTQGWSADEVAPYLLAIDGFVQCDDYKSYSHKVTLDEGTERVLVDPTRRLGCVMHVRRRFHEALKLGDKRAARGVELIGAIYDIERLAKTEGLTPEQRLELRTDWSLPLLDLFDAWVDELVPKCLPKSPLGEALGYAQHQRPYRAPVLHRWSLRDRQRPHRAHPARACTESRTPLVCHGHRARHRGAQ